MTLDLIGILCSITVLNPSVREGALAFLFARTAKVTSLPKWDARYSSFVFSQAFTSAGHHILYVPLPFVSHSFSSHNKHSRFSHVRLTLPQSCCVSTGKLITWWAVQVPLLREVKVEKVKREIWNLKKSNPTREGTGELYTRQRVITKTLGLSSNRTGGTNLQQPGNHGHGSTQQRAFLAL